MPAQLRRRVLRRDALRLERLALLDPRYMARERAHDAQDGLRVWIARALEQRLARAQHGGDVAAPPRIGQREVRGLRARRDELLHLRDRDLLPLRRPRG